MNFQLVTDAENKNTLLVKSLLQNGHLNSLPPKRSFYFCIKF